MPAELIDINGEFDLGNQFTLSTATYLSESLDDRFRVIVKYQGQDLPTYDDHKHNIVFCTSKEIHSTPREFFRDDVLIIFQHYFMIDEWGYPIHNPLSYPTPLGTFKDPPQPLNITPIPERKYDFCFMGQIPHTGTRDCFKRCLDKLMEETGDKFKYFVKVTDGFSQGLDKDEYFDILGNSKLCLCPQGAHSPETFRFFEALSVGTFPVIEKLPRVWYYEEAPFFRTNSWYDIDKTLSQSLNFLQTKSSRQSLMALADYAQSVLDPKALSNTLKEKVEYRLGTRNQTKNALQEIRKGITQYDNLGTVEL